MIRRRLAIALLFAASFAQGQTPPPLVETMEVRVVNIEVVVTDRQGNRITGLTQDDFELYERRKKQVITNFSEIRDEGAPAAQTTEDVTATAGFTPAVVQRRNTVIFFIDTSSLDPRRRKGIFEELRRFAGTALRPGDRAMVALWNKRVRVLLPFSESSEEVQRALYEVEKDATGMNLIQNRRITQDRIANELELSLSDPTAYPIGTAYANALGHARTYSEEMYAHARSLMVAVSATLGTFAAPEDKKALVFVGDYMPAKAGADMYQFTHDTFSQYVGGATRDTMMESVRTGNWLSGIVRAANATGVTAYMISGGGLQQLTVDAAEGSSMQSTLAQTVLEGDTRQSFVQTAEDTGGIAFTGGDARNVLQRIADDFRSYYSIGFKPSGKIDGKARAIEVKTKNPAYVVRARQSYVLRTADEEFADRVTASVYQEETGGDLQVRTGAATPYLEGRNNIRVPVKVYVQGKNVTLIPKGRTLEGELNVFVCAGSSESGASKVLRHSQRLSIPAADEERFRAGHLTFSFEVIIGRKGENVVAAGVRDTVGGSYGLARAAVHGEPVPAPRQPPVATDF